MTQPNLGELMQKAQEVQKRMADVQRELAGRTVEGTSGGGMVTATVTGGLRVLEVNITQSLLDSGDRSMIQDLTAAAVNAALANAQRMVQEELQRASAGLGINLPGFPPTSTSGG